MGNANDVRLIRTTGLPGAERRALERAVHRGTFERVRPGVLVHSGALDGLREDQRHLVTIRAAATRLRPQDVLSHQSACAVLGLPFIGAWLSKVHVVDPTTTHTRVTAWFVRHGVADRPPRELIQHDDLRATAAARTAVDIATSNALVVAVPVVDHVLRTGTASPDALTSELTGLRKGRGKAQTAVALGSALSGSPAESLCRVRFHQLGVPPAVQQHVFARAGERRAVVDFWFAEQGVVVEADGRGKYEDPTMLAGRSTADAHWQEKQREDFVRSFPEVRTVVRLTWADLMDRERVRAKLVRAGVPCR